MEKKPRVSDKPYQQKRPKIRRSINRDLRERIPPLYDCFSDSLVERKRIGMRLKIDDIDKSHSKVICSGPFHNSEDADDQQFIFGTSMEMITNLIHLNKTIAG